MTIDILIEAMEMLRDRGDHPDYKMRLIDRSICELKSFKDYAQGPEDPFYGTVHVISVEDAINLQNTLLYDEFGKLAKRGEHTFSNYMNVAHKTFGFNYTYWQFLHSGYDLINDLWHDNERAHYNNEDGTFKGAPD